MSKTLHDKLIQANTSASVLSYPLQIIDLQIHVEFPFVEIHHNRMTLLHNLKVNLFNS